MACASAAVAQANPSPSILKKQPPKSKPIVSSIPPQPASAPAIPAAPQQAPSLLQEPAKRAQVKVEADELSVQAENANLSQILKDISSSTGMKLEGFQQDGRIFGNYGPGPAREVLGQLLDGTGYNVLMVGGTQKSVPRELVLTPRSSSHPTAMATPAPGAAKPEEDEDAAGPEEELPAQPAQRPEIQVPTSSPAGQQQSGNGVKSPQELLEELRKIRGQNQNQDQQQSPQSQQQSSPNQQQSSPNQQQSSPNQPPQ